MSLDHLAVDEGWRGRGLGFVTLQLGDRVPMPSKPVCQFGNIARDQARFFQRAGFTVFQPGEALQLPGASVALSSSSEPYPCMMYRTWSLADHQ